MTDPNKQGNGDTLGAQPAGSCWEDSVYRYVARLHHAAVADEDDPEIERLEKLVQELVDRSMSDDLYLQLDAEAKADRKSLKQDRKQQQRSRPLRAADEQPQSVNVADLKKRIFNRHVSRENVIKALEALPSAERKATIAELPPGLKRKLGKYIKD